ncbi:MAG: S49 family peptidase [Methylococcales bacterium]
MRNPALFSRIFNTPLMIQPMKLDAILAGIGSRFGLDAPKPEAALTVEGDYKRPGYEVIGNVGVIDIFGVLAHRGGMQADSSYILGYDRIGMALSAALNDTDVSSVLLQLDSPGGEVSGAFELAAQIKAADQVKPVHAVISSMAASAGYLLASAARSIAISTTGMAGSIGVVMRHVDVSKMAADDGFKVTYIYAGDRKVDGNPYEPLPADVKANFQTEIDKIYGLFVDTIAANRRVSVDVIRAQQAAIYTGQDALDAKLADSIATPDEVLASLQASNSNFTGVLMSTEKTETPSLSDQDREKIRAEGFTAGKAEGAKVERERLAAILNHEAYAGREAPAKTMALETDMTADQVIKVLGSMPQAESPKATGTNQFAEHMAALGNPKVGLDAETSGESSDEETDEQLAAKVVAIHNRTRGIK